MTTALILCPGASLISGQMYPRNSDYKIVICVNSARDAIDYHDWWVNGDYATGPLPTQEPDKRTLKGCFSNRQVKDTYTLFWRNLGVEPTNYSGVACLYLAAYLGCDTILVEGADMCGNRYFNGSILGHMTEERWADQRIKWKQALIDINRRVYRKEVL